jgi:hypothetical protein
MKTNYNIIWQKPYTVEQGYQIIAELETLKADLIERLLDYKGVTEAQEIIKRIMTK